MENKLLKKYYLTFGEFPPLLQTMSYENDFYQDLMKKAIENDEPITRETLYDINNYDLIDNED